MEPSASRLLVSFRGEKIELPLVRGTSVGSLKSLLVQSADNCLELNAGDVKLFHKGKVLADDNADLHDIFKAASAKAPKIVRLMATGISGAEAKACNKEFQDGLRAAPRVRDDLTDKGRAEMSRLQYRGRKTLAVAAARSRGNLGKSNYGFGNIETIPNLPEETKAREILTSLASDPGILACMTKHKWNVGCLAEMYPEGKVGESKVCVMGLNQNKGEKIILRLRTDDLKGFRKILSIRKVLFHELAHNVHSEHNGDFFLLMRQIEKECNEMNWTQGSGFATGDALSHPAGDSFDNSLSQFEGGTFRLGGSSKGAKLGIPARELAAQAALIRLTAEEEEIQRSCGCDQARENKKASGSGRS